MSLGVGVVGSIGVCRDEDEGGWVMQVMWLWERVVRGWGEGKFLLGGCAVIGSVLCCLTVRTGLVGVVVGRVIGKVCIFAMGVCEREGWVTERVVRVEEWGGLQEG